MVLHLIEFKHEMCTKKKKYKDRYRSENFFETRRKSLSHTFPKF